MKKCLICNEEFETERKFHFHIKKHNITNEEYYTKYEHIEKKQCKTCGDPTPFVRNKYRKYCSKSCACSAANKQGRISIKEKYGVDNVSQIPGVSDKVKQTKKERYGNETYNNMEKNVQTCLNKYGVEHVSQSQEIRKRIKESISKVNQVKAGEKRKNTVQKKYGKKFISQTSVWKKSNIQNSLLKYGETHPLKNKEVLKNAQAKLQERYGVINISQLDSTKEKVKQTFFNKRKKALELANFDDKIISYPTNFSVEMQCITCKKNYIVNIGFLSQRNKFDVTLCTNCNPVNTGSDLQNRFVLFIESLGFTIIKNYRFDENSKHEIDIFIPEKNIGLEINGIFWHSEVYKHSNYHKEKTKLASKNGVQLIHLWEDDLKFKKELVESRIKAILGLNQTLYARKTKVKFIDKNLSKEFFDKFHLHGNVRNTLSIGLFYDEELISSISLRKKKTPDEYEISRYATKSGFGVIGGFAKMLKFISNELKPINIFTYYDLDWKQDNNVYENNNFVFVKETQPQYHWVVGGKRENRLKFTKKNLVREGFDENKTEVQIMHDRGYYRIFNAGNNLYKFKKDI